MSTVWKKFTSPLSEPNSKTFPELPECLTWFRILIGIGYGTTLGVQGSHGGLSVFVGFSALVFVPLMYGERILKADVESYSNLTFTGVPNAFGLMLLIWVIFFTMEHAEVEERFTSMLMNSSTESVLSEDDVNVNVNVEPEF